MTNIPNDPPSAAAANWRRTSQAMSAAIRPLLDLAAQVTDQNNPVADAEQAVVIGQVGDRSGMSEECYGPYPKVTAAVVADQLSAGNWCNMHWFVVPIGALPGEGR